MTSYFDFDVPATWSDYDYNSQVGYQSSQPSSAGNGRWCQNQDISWATAGIENALAAPKDELRLEEDSSPVLLHAPIPRPARPASFFAPAPIETNAHFLANPGTEGTLLTTPFPLPTTPFPLPTTPFPLPTTPFPLTFPLPIDYDQFFANDPYDPYAAGMKTSLTGSYDPYYAGMETSLTMASPSPGQMLSMSNAQAQGMEPASRSNPTLASSTPSTSTSSMSAPEMARYARLRLCAMAESIGFTPTHPDTITAHEKKRHYYECLEEYVLHVHEQIKLAGLQPIPFERVPTYQGLHSRSIRTILVHMQNEARELNLEVIAEEKRFLTLRDTLLQQQAAEDSDASDQLQATSADCV